MPENNSSTRSIPKVAEVLERNSNKSLRVIFQDSDVFVLKEFSKIDRSIYGRNGGWTCYIIEAISGRRPNFHKIFHSGIGLDFLEQDVASIEDVNSKVTLFNHA